MARIRVEAFLLCNSVVVDQQTGSITIQGVFDQIFTQAFPTSQNCTLYGRFGLTESGSCDVEIEMRTPSGKTDRTPPQKAAPRKGFDIVQLATQVAVPLPEAGRYELSLIVDGEKVANFYFTATATAAPPQGSQISVPGRA